MEYRVERDTFGEVQVPAGMYYGAQTARALSNFKIGSERIPREFIRALGAVKKAAAIVNCEQGLLPVHLTEGSAGRPTRSSKVSWTTISR